MKKFFKENPIFSSLLVSSLIFRVAFSVYGLPNYSIDENEVVEMAIGFTQGDLDYRFYKYGPFLSYLLAIIYKFYASFLYFFSSGYASSDDVLQRVFFYKTEFYVIARIFHSVIGIISAILIKKILELINLKQVATFTACLFLIPYNEIISNYTVRIDTGIALFALISIYFYLKFINLKKINLFYLFAFSSGLCFGVKPLQSAFFIVVFILLFYHSRKDIEVPFKVISILLLGMFLSNPYAFLKLSDFVQYNYNSLLQGGDVMKNKPKGYNFSWMLSYFGNITGLILGLSFLYSLYDAVKSLHDKKKIIILLFPFLYIFGFLFFEIRQYWYLPIIPFFFISLGIVLEKILKLIKPRYIFAVIPIVFLSEISLKVFDVISKSVLKEPTAKVMSNYIQQNIGTNSKIHIIGGHVTGLPILVDKDIQKEASRGQYFMYHRFQNKPYVKLFQNAYISYRKKKAVYDLLHSNEFYGPKMNAMLMKVGFIEYCKKNKIKYVLTESLEESYSSPWEEKIKMLYSIKENDKYYGRNFKLFEVY